MGPDFKFKMTEIISPEGETTSEKLSKVLGLMIHPRKPIDQAVAWMLSDRPKSSDQNRVKTWTKIKRPTINLFEKFYNRAGFNESVMGD